MDNSYSKYLGCNFKFNGNSLIEGFDCINLCCAIAKDRGVHIPNINHLAFSLDTYHTLFGQKDDKQLWQEVQPQANALVVFKINGVVKHVGFMLDNLNFIHIMEHSRVSVEKITSIQWNKRIVGFYKYIGK